MQDIYIRKRQWYQSRHDYDFIELPYLVLQITMINTLMEWLDG